MRPYSIPILILLALGAGCQKSREYGAWEPEESAVFHALIDDLYSEAIAQGMVVDVDCMTVQGPKIREPIRNNRFLGDRGNPKGLVEDFAYANAQPLEMPDSVIAEAKCTKITKAELRELFDDKNMGWEEFYRRKPKSLGIHCISRVGFSKDRSIALVYFDYQWQDLAGQGRYYVFVKKDKKWEISPMLIGPVRIS